MTSAPVVRKNNFTSAYQTRREFDNLLDSLFNANLMLPLEGYKPWSGIFTSPLSDISENAKGYKISMEIPGVPESDIEINVDGNVLTVKGEKKEEKEEKDKSYYYSERSYGSFERSIRLPENADVDSVTASCKNGVVEIQIPKKVQQTVPAKRIEIKKE